MESEEETPIVNEVQISKTGGKSNSFASYKTIFCLCCQYQSIMHDPQERHLQTVKILQYLKATPGRGLLFKFCGDLSI